MSDSSNTNKIPKIQQITNTSSSSAIRGIATSIEYIGNGRNSKSSNNSYCCKEFPECIWLYRKVQSNNNNIKAKAAEINLAKRAYSYSRSLRSLQEDRLTMPESAR